MTTALGSLAAGETLADQAYRAVRQAIAAGELRPGEKITERGLASRLAVSPTPVREAIRRLEQDGLVQRTGARGLTVASIGQVAVEDLAEVETALRGLVARFAAKHATESQLDHLDAILDEADGLRAIISRLRAEGQAADTEILAVLDLIQRFNDAVDECAANPVLIRLLDQTRVFSRSERRARTLREVAISTARGGDFVKDRYAGHRELVRALRARDAQTAERLVVEHAQDGLRALRVHLRDDEQTA